jgi:hypothetical protein
MASNETCKDSASNANEPDAECSQSGKTVESTETGNNTMEITKATSDLEFSDIVKLFSKSEKEVLAQTTLMFCDCIQ